MDHMDLVVLDSGAHRVLLVAVEVAVLLISINVVGGMELYLTTHTI
jgi:hypothetical protein